ncbi:protein NipSnap homolog 3A isoform 2-T2 [Geothlypis trichas]
MLPPALLRRTLAAAARQALPRAGPQVHLATGPRQNNGIFYEIRTYDIKPAKMKEFLEVVSKYFHFRTAHSELVGFWYSELGAMNKVLHIWKYGTVSIHPFAPLCSLCVPCLLGKKCLPFLLGVYEWVTFQMKPGGPALWGEAFRAAINAHINTGYTKLIGVFHTEYGLLNTVHVLWWNESPDQRAAGRHSAHEDARVVAAVRDSVRFLESQQNMLLIPLQCSPLK